MLNKLLNKFLPCQKIFDDLFEDHEKAKESNNKAGNDQTNASNRLIDACNINLQNATILCFAKQVKKI